MGVFCIPVAWEILRIAPGPAEWLFSQESRSSGRIVQSVGVGRLAVAGPNTADADRAIGDADVALPPTPLPTHEDASYASADALRMVG